MKGVNAFIAVCCVVALAGCASGATSAGSGHLSSVRSGAESACHYSAHFLAQQYGTSADPQEIAQAYADQLGGDDPGTRNAAIDGCLAGIR
jgi:hypothetical protein